MDRVGRAVETGFGVASSAELSGAGVTPDALRWAVRSGRLHRVRVGVYACAESWAAADEHRRHALKVLAAQRVSPTLIATGRSAAALLGLPLPGGPPELPQLVLPRDEELAGAGGRRGGALRRRAWLAVEEVWVVDGVRVTSPVRTVIDCCRELDDGWALAVADAAAARWGVTGDAVREHLLGTPVSRGRTRAAWVATHLDPRAESPLESLARAVIITADLPVPEPQVWLTTYLGRFRVDLLCSLTGVVTEADGKLKYAGPEDVFAEKQREDAIRDQHYEVVRFTMADYYTHRTDWLTRYRRAISRSRHRHRHQRGLPPPSG